MKYTKVLEKLSKKTLNAEAELRWMKEELIKRRSKCRNGLEPWKMYSQVNELTEKEKKRLELWVHERVELNKPLQYILGSQPFAGMDLRVRKPVLIPRPETEEWTMDLVDRIGSKPLSILDLCTGSGCIALGLAKHCKVDVVGVDVSPSSIKLAKVNARRCKLNVDFRLGSIFDSFLLDLLQDKAPFDILVSNPPYISPDKLNTLDKDVRDWEDHLALVDDADGNSFYKRIAELTPQLVKPSQLSELPRVVLEIGQGQASVVSDFFRHIGQVKIFKDCFGQDRWIHVY